MLTCFIITAIIQFCLGIYALKLIIWDIIIKGRR